MNNSRAPGQPGLPPKWTSSAKDGAGTAVSRPSRVWYSVSHGIVDEIYHPFVDQVDTRDFGLIVADGKDFFSEEKRDTTHEIQALAPGVSGLRGRVDRAGPLKENAMQLHHNVAVVTGAAEIVRRWSLGVHDSPTAAPVIKVGTNQ